MPGSARPTSRPEKGHSKGSITIISDTVFDCFRISVGYSHHTTYTKAVIEIPLLNLKIVRLMIEQGDGTTVFQPRRNISCIRSGTENINNTRIVSFFFDFGVFSFFLLWISRSFPFLSGLGFFLAISFAFLRFLL